MIKWLFCCLFCLITISAAAADPTIEIIVDISDQEMYVEAPEGTAVWEVSTGKPNYDTPIGIFTPQRMDYMHYSKKYDNAPMPFSIFFLGGYAIHGTEHIESLGLKASKGCIRLHPNAAAVLYELVEMYGMESTEIIIIP